jgi:hypothetical protein
MKGFNGTREIEGEDLNGIWKEGFLDFKKYSK